MPRFLLNAKCNKSIARLSIHITRQTWRMTRTKKVTCWIDDEWLLLQLLKLIPGSLLHALAALYFSCVPRSRHSGYKRLVCSFFFYQSHGIVEHLCGVWYNVHIHSHRLFVVDSFNKNERERDIVKKECLIQLSGWDPLCFRFYKASHCLGLTRRHNVICIGSELQ